MAGALKETTGQLQVGNLIITLNSNRTIASTNPDFYHLGFNEITDSTHTIYQQALNDTPQDKRPTSSLLGNTLRRFFSPHGGSFRNMEVTYGDQSVAHLNAYISTTPGARGVRSKGMRKLLHAVIVEEFLQRKTNESRFKFLEQLHANPNLLAWLRKQTKLTKEHEDYLHNISVSVVASFAELPPDAILELVNERASTALKFGIHPAHSVGLIEDPGFLKEIWEPTNEAIRRFWISLAEGDIDERIGIRDGKVWCPNPGAAVWSQVIESLKENLKGQNYRDHAQEHIYSALIQLALLSMPERIKLIRGAQSPSFPHYARTEPLNHKGAVITPIHNEEVEHEATEVMGYRSFVRQRTDVLLHVASVGASARSGTIVKVGREEDYWANDMVPSWEVALHRRIAKEVGKEFLR